MLSWVAKCESQRKSDRLRAKVQTRRNRAGALGQRTGWGGGSKGATAGCSPAKRTSLGCAPSARPGRPSGPSPARSVSARARWVGSEVAASDGHFVAEVPIKRPPQADPGKWFHQVVVTVADGKVSVGQVPPRLRSRETLGVGV
jgi:hypothetical protein